MPQQAQIKISTSTHTLLGNPRTKITGKEISPASIRESLLPKPSSFLTVSAALWQREYMDVYRALITLVSNFFASPKLQHHGKLRKILPKTKKSTLS
jgi:hypothetical protein